MIRPARVADIEAMHRIRLAVRENRLADPSRVGPEGYRCRLDPPGVSLVAESNGRVVGFAVGDAESASIWALFVDPPFEGHGTGRLLHDALVASLFAKGLTELHLSTDSGTRAERLYRRAGWQPGGETKDSEVSYRLTPADWVR
jgi:ribosomal protein S18 acetylase RimI-like enzyme